MGYIVAVARQSDHRFSKRTCDAIRLVAGRGVEGDAHCGRTVQHRSRLAKTPGAPNLRQVHLIHAELLEELALAGFAVAPGTLGENLTTRGVALLDMPRGTRLKIGGTALVELSGLRNPCRQIDDNVGAGAMAATLGRAPDGTLVRKAGVMAVVLAGGEIRPGDRIAVELPALHVPLEPV